MVAVYSENPSLNPAEVYIFSVQMLLKRTKINEQRPGLTHLKRDIFTFAKTFSEHRTRATEIRMQNNSSRNSCSCLMAGEDLHRVLE